MSDREPAQAQPSRLSRARVLDRRRKVLFAVLVVMFALGQMKRLAVKRAGDAPFPDRTNEARDALLQDLSMQGFNPADRTLARRLKPRLVGVHRLPEQVPLRFLWTRFDDGKPVPPQSLVLAEYQVIGDDDFVGAPRLGNPGGDAWRELDRLWFDASGQEVAERVARTMTSRDSLRRFGVFSLPGVHPEVRLFWVPETASEPAALTTVPQLKFLPPESFKPIGFGMLDDDNWVLVVRAENLLSVPDCERLPYSIRTDLQLRHLVDLQVTTWVLDAQGARRPPQLGELDTPAAADLACVVSLVGTPQRLLDRETEVPWPSGDLIKRLSGAVLAEMSRNAEHR